MTRLTFTEFFLSYIYSHITHRTVKTFYSNVDLASSHLIFCLSSEFERPVILFLTVLFYVPLSDIAGKTIHFTQIYLIIAIQHLCILLKFTLNLHFQ